MRHGLRLAAVVVVTSWMLLTASASAQTFNSGSTGTDLAFSPETTTTLTLPVSGVFNFTTINIPSGVTVRFNRNTTNTPVTLLASGNVVIAGTIDVSGGNAGNSTPGVAFYSNAGLGGPGGFDGGAGADGLFGTRGGSGLGPGGGDAGGIVGSNLNGSSGGGYGTMGGAGAPNGGPTQGGAIYGAPTLLPLVGGSGGGGGGIITLRVSTGGGGGGGGGALLIASSGSITFSGSIIARGGNGGNGDANAGRGAGGSGGAVRMVATTITGQGTFDLAGGLNGGLGAGAGGAGRVRVEAFTNTLAATVPTGTASVDRPTYAALPSTPTLRVTAVSGVATPATTTGSLTAPDVVLPSTTTNPVTISLAGANIPLGTVVAIKVLGLNGASATATSSALSGTLASSTATASVTIPTDQPSTISATATYTLTASIEGGPVFVQGDEIDRVVVSTTTGGESRVAYVTKSGRNIAADPIH